MSADDGSTDGAAMDHRSTGDSLTRRLLSAREWLREVSPLTERRPPAAGGRVERRRLDGRSYDLFVPERADRSGRVLPLVVMLHGCGSSPTTFAAETRMNAVAAAEGFLVAYPKQSIRQQPLRCWRWYDESQATRDNGDLAFVTRVVEAVSGRHAVDADRTYVAGHSAGGAMAIRALAEYPDVFAAAGVHAGLPYDDTGSWPSALWRMWTGGSARPDLDEVVSAAVVDPDRPLPTIVFHGTDDDVVDVENARRLTVQVVRANDLHGRSMSTDGGALARNRSSAAGEPKRTEGTGGDGLEPDAIETGAAGPHEWTRRQFRDRAGRVLVEEWLIEGMGHVWTGGAGHDGAGVHEELDASRLTWAFFERHSTAELAGDGRWRPVQLPLVGTVGVPTLRGVLDRVRRRVRSR